MKNNNKDRIRVVTFLCRKQVDYLDRLGKDVLFSSGKKLSRSQFLSSLVDMLIKANISIDELNPDLEKVDLSEQLLKVMCEHQQKAEDEKDTP